MPSVFRRGFKNIGVGDTGQPLPMIIGLRAGRLVWQGTDEDIRRMNDAEFKEIYGEEAERTTAGLPRGQAS